MPTRKLTLRQFCDVVRGVIDDLPAPFRDRLENVAVDVFDEPSPQDLAHASDTSNPPGQSELLGLFIGTSRLDSDYGTSAPNQIKIFRRPLERLSRTRQALIHNIRSTVLHELAHHFGFSEDDLAEFERREERWLQD